jgi:transketolase C-terminal domain/subunit
VEELLDEGVARNVVAVSAVAATARCFGSCSILVDSASLVVVVVVVATAAAAAVEGTHIDLDELAMARGLVSPLQLLGRVAGGARVCGLRGGL